MLIIKVLLCTNLALPYVVRKNPDHIAHPKLLEFGAFSLAWLVMWKGSYIFLNFITVFFIGFYIIMLCVLAVLKYTKALFYVFLL